MDFSLLDDPWINVTDLGGAPRVISMREAYAHGDRYLRLSAGLDATNLAVTRLLLAPLYRAWDSRRWRNTDDAMDHWAAKWEQDTLLDSDLAAYLTRWEAHFNLGGDTPFLQVADLVPTNQATGWKPISALFPDVPAADKGEMFTSRSGSFGATPAEVANMLLTTNAVDPGSIHTGMAGDRRVSAGKTTCAKPGWAGQFAGTTVLGRNLRETLLLNYVPARDTAGKDDLPYWEVPGLTAAGSEKGTAPDRLVGPVALLVFTGRRFRVRWEDGLGTAVLNGAGDCLPFPGTPLMGFETMAGWSVARNKTKTTHQLTYYSPSMDTGRALWQSMERLLPPASAKATIDLGRGATVDTAVHIAPRIVSWVSQLVGSDILPGDYPLMIRQSGATYDTNMSKITDLPSDGIRVSSCLVGTEKLKATAGTAVDRTAYAAGSLRWFCRNVASAVGGTYTDKAADRFVGQFYSRIDTAFRRWVADLGPDTDRPAALVEWANMAYPLALEVAKEHLASQPPAVWGGRMSAKNPKSPDGETHLVTGALAYRWLDTGLRKALLAQNNLEGENR